MKRLAGGVVALLVTLAPAAVAQQYPPQPPGGGGAAGGGGASEETPATTRPDSPPEDPGRPPQAPPTEPPGQGGGAVGGGGAVVADGDAGDAGDARDAELARSRASVVGGGAVGVESQSFTGVEVAERDSVGDVLGEAVEEGAISSSGTATGGLLVAGALAVGLGSAAVVRQRRSSRTIAS